MAKKILLLSLFCLLCSATLSFSSSISSRSYPRRIPRLTPHLSTILRDFPAEDDNNNLIEASSSAAAAINSGNDSNDFVTYFYDQTLDHFNYNPEISYRKFKQRFVVNSKFWGGSQSNSPIFAFLGAEAPIDGDVSSIGLLSDNAPRFKSLSVYIEVFLFFFFFSFSFIITKFYDSKFP